MLDTLPVTHIAGVGRAKAAALAELGVHSVLDVLHYFPFRHEDRSPVPFEEFRSGESVTARVLVDGEVQAKWVNGRSMCRAPIRVDGRVRLTGVWFNQPYIRQQLYAGRVIDITGKYEESRRSITVSRTSFGRSGEGGLVPVYRGSKSLPSSQIQKIITQALAQYGEQLPELLPRYLTDKYRLCLHAEAVTSIHAPREPESLRQARRRLAFEEFFVFQLQLQWARRNRAQVEKGIARVIPAHAFDSFCESLPARMTHAQVKACTDIATDLERKEPMNRLLQGDVGSGKTLVALWAAFATRKAGFQTALMAPTEILAEQHAREARRRLEPLGMRIELLTGSTAERDRGKLLQSLAEGRIDVIVGTHALLTDDVTFGALGLVIIDEQHRFGVAQRSLLRAKGDEPDLLLLSATPIPRTLALAIYGDLDISVLDELPAGRKPIVTRVLPLRDESVAIRFLRQELAKKRQAYVVAPLIEETEELPELQSAESLFDKFREQFAGYRVSLLHGRMTPKEKDEVMRLFLRGDVDVLVSTTVIEVGIDVPNATVMMIYHAERFGLAQLHQLRGRVGRGEAESTCLLMSDSRGELAEARLDTMVSTADGFVIADKDLELRGPGEFLGVRQSGLPEFTVGDLSRDFRMMEVARDEATELLSLRDFWLLPKYSELRACLKAPSLQASS